MIKQHQMFKLTQSTPILTLDLKNDTLPENTNVILLWRCDYCHPEQRYKSAWCQVEGKKVIERVRIDTEYLTNTVGSKEMDMEKDN